MDVRFDAEDEAITGDHQVQERSLVPAAVLLVRLARHLHSCIGTFTLHDVRFLRPLYREEMHRCRLEIRVQPHSTDDFKVELASGETVYADAWARASRSNCGQDDHSASDAEPGTPRVGNWYQQLASRGNFFGERLQLIQTIVPSHSRPAELFTVEIARGAAACVLDACFHAVLACSLHDSGCYVLQTIEALSFSQGTLADEIGAVTCDVAYRGAATAATLVANVRARAPAGEWFLDARGVSFVQAHGFDLRSAIAADANFGIGPLKEVVDLLGADLGLTLSIGPYDQVCQSLHDADHAFGRSDFRALYLFISLQFWWKRRALSHGPERKAALAKGARARLLPNGLEILELNGYETDHLYREIFDEQVYLQGGVELSPGDVVLDIGANIGLFSLYLLESYPGLQVIAFEPSSVTAAVLKANVSGRGAVTVVEAGVGRCRGSARFYHYPNSTVFSSYGAAPDADARTLRSVVTTVLRTNGYAHASEADISHLMSDRLRVTEFETCVVSVSDVIDDKALGEIALLKIDAEKSEMDILLGIRPEHWPRIRQITLEFHPGPHASLEAVLDLLRAHGFQPQIWRDSVLEDSGLCTIVGRRDSPVRQSTPSNAPDRFGLAEPIKNLVRAIGEFRQSHAAPVTIVVAPESDDVRGSAYVRSEHEATIRQLRGACAGITDVDLVSGRDIEQMYPVEKLESSAVEREAGLPYDRQWYAGTGAWLLRNHIARIRRPHKVVVVDCDDTLWAGNCAERNGKAVYIGGRHRALQEWLLTQRERGMLICLSSKNDEGDVLRVLGENEAMLLRQDDIAAWRIDWDPKSRAIASLARELNLGLDSFIFIDNSAIECAEVSAGCEGVLALQFPEDDAQAATFLRHIWAFDVARGERQPDRTLLYRAERSRRRARASSSSFREFLDSLQLEVTFPAARDGDFDRVSELSRRTNQFTLNREAYSAGEVAALLRHHSHVCHVVRASDRFGNYGLVGAVIFRMEGAALVVTSLMLSCRILGRGVELELLRFLGRSARTRGANTIRLLVTATGRNTPALQFLRKVQSREHEIDVGDVEALQREALEPAAEESSHERNTEAPAEAPHLDPWDQRYRNAQWLSAVLSNWSSAEKIAAAVWKRLPLDSAGDAPGSLEDRVRRIWQSVLGRGVPDTEASFFSLGGTSLQLVRVLNEISGREGCRLTLADAYATPSIGGLCDLVWKNLADAIGREAGRATQIEHLRHDATLSAAQQALWFVYLSDRRSATFNVPLALILRGDVRPELLKKAIATIVGRTSVLNTTYELKGKMTIGHQHGSSALEWSQSDGTDFDDTRLVQHLLDRAQRPINLSSGPLMRAELIAWRGHLQVLSIITHHIAVDYESMVLLVEELSAEYGRLSGSVLPVRSTGESFDAWVQVEKARLTPARIGELEHFWAKELRGLSGELLTAAHPIGPITGDGVLLTLPAEIAAALASKAAMLNVSRVTLLLALYGVFLGRETGSDDVVVGTPVSLRSEDRFAGTLGNFINLVPLRLRLAGVKQLSAAVGVAREALLRALAAAELPLHTILRAGNPEPGGGRIMALRTTLALHERTTSWPATHMLAHGRISHAFPFGGALSAQVLGLRQQAGHCDLAIDMFDFGSTLGVDFKYSTRAVDREGSEGMARRFVEFIGKSLAMDRQGDGQWLSR